MTRMWIMTIGLLATAATWTPPVGAGSCHDESWGWGWETATCTATCSAAEWLVVTAGVDDDGSVNAQFTCGGATAYCSDDDGGCGARSSTVTSSSGSGTCTADGYGGSGAWVYTHVTVDCHTEASGECGAANGLAHTLFRVLDCEMGWAVALRAPAPVVSPGHVLTSWTHVTIAEGVVLGTRCTLAEGCLPVATSCAADGGRWSCGVGVA